MSKSKVLIMGTEHSYRKSSETTQLWHDYLKTEYDMEVTNISQPEITTLGMLTCLLMYVEQNPNERWDLAIIEAPPLKIRYDVATSFRKWKTKLETMYPNINIEDHKIQAETEYKHLLPGIEISQNGRLPDDLYRLKDQSEQISRYFKDYSFTPLHSIETYGPTLSMMSVLNGLATHAKFFYVTNDRPPKTSVPNDFDKKWFDMLLKDYLLCDKVEFDEEKKHEHIWINCIKPFIESL